MQQHHLLFDKVDYVIDVLSVAPDEVLFFLQDHLDQLLMVVADLINVIPILRLQLRK